MKKYLRSVSHWLLNTKEVKVKLPVIGYKVLLRNLGICMNLLPETSALSSCEPGDRLKRKTEIC